MANAYIDSSLLDRAIFFAVKAHANTERRGKGFPYIVHPMEAVEIVATISTDQELLAAAALHDTVEDTDVTVEQIRAEFGDRIATLVDSESDRFEAGVSEEDSWHARKQAAIDRLAAASRDAQIVAIGDKLSNMRAIYRDYLQLGDALWSRFHAKDPKDHAWHYRGLARALSPLMETLAYKEFVELIAKVFGHEEEWEPVRIDLADYEESGDGYTAVSYNHRDGRTMIKLYNDFVPRQVAQRELNVARSLIWMGIKTPKPGRFVTDGRRFGSEFQRISPKESFARAISNHPDQLEKYTHLFAALVKKMHATACDTSVFPPVHETYKNIIWKSRDFTPDEKVRLIGFIDTLPVAQTCVHGDMHIGNIITNGEETWWIDTADFSWGHPLYDIGLIYLLSKIERREILERLFHNPKERLEQFWDIFMEDYFDVHTPKEKAGIEKMVAPYAALKMIFFANLDHMEPSMRAYIHETLLK